jgi:phosphoenolpyruvate carboxykinase (ATP)
VFANPSVPVLVEASLARGEGQLTDTGALNAQTGARTGRSPKDRFIVRDAETEVPVNWGNVNQPVDRVTFDRVMSRAIDHLNQQDLFVCDGEACADPSHRLRVRVIAEKAWHALFSRCLFLRPPREELARFKPDWHILAVPECRPDPTRDEPGAKVFVGLDFARRLVLIAGTLYAGEIKKSVFSILNYLLPQRGVFPMHCSANVGTRSDVALFFGLSGTGKTTLSADPHRRLIGDDEHGWANDGVFNIEGGCYAKTIKLSRLGEPQIWNSIRFGSVLENVVLDPVTRIPDYNSARVTENTRAAYPVEFIPNCEQSGRGGHPTNIFFLTCDAFGVLPPLSRLNSAQAMFHFLSGYTAKVAGTETGVTEPEAEFSTCFAAPFLPLHPTRYAEMLAQKMDQFRTPVWLVNTGWIRGPYGVGHRIELVHTRAMLRAALDGLLEEVPFDMDPVFGFEVPRECPDVPIHILRPRAMWADPVAYDTQANRLAKLFREKFAPFADKTSEAVRNAAPRVR